ncbi:MAG: hypothetical protein M2R45_03920 [Verrucomicrobia subdivision 3 bacterium]|nr:hypothetical protein [Limisphaerales bacterium]MCS1417500.1 hypothetical protein [Limisphaerales bacterium]
MKTIVLKTLLALSMAGKNGAQSALHLSKAVGIGVLTAGMLLFGVPVGTPTAVADPSDGWDFPFGQCIPPVHIFSVSIHVTQGHSYWNPKGQHVGNRQIVFEMSVSHSGESGLYMDGETFDTFDYTIYPALGPLSFGISPQTPGWDHWDPDTVGLFNTWVVYYIGSPTATVYINRNGWSGTYDNYSVPVYGNLPAFK